MSSVNISSQNCNAVNSIHNITHGKKKTKCSLLILMLLIMCGDTGISTNPGPISQHDLNICEVSEDGYLNSIDLDMNYFNETELNSSHFNSYTIDEFKKETFN